MQPAGRALCCSILMVFFLGLMVPAASLGATYRVAQDGSGDFTLVQDAVEASAAGDTVTIAPGEYPEVRSYQAPGGIVDVIAFVDVAELTIIGDGRDMVTLGPETPAPKVEFGPLGIMTSVDGNVRVSGVTIRNVADGVSAYGEWLEIASSRFVHCYDGVDAFVTGFTTVHSSEFIDCDTGIIVFVARGATGALVESCQFRNSGKGIDLQTPNSEIRNCTFDNDNVGAQVSFGGVASVESCTFNGSRNLDLAIAGGAQVHLIDSKFIGHPPVHIDVSGHLTGSGNILLGGSGWAIWVSGRSAVQFNNNHIFNAGDYTIVLSSSDTPIPPHNFEYNYWGTTDTDQIDAWILDENDPSVLGYGVVDYLPLHTGPVGTEDSSFGGLKARFRGLER